MIGQIGFHPGSEWGTGDTSTANNALRRKDNICQGDADGSDAFDPVLCQNLTRWNRRLHREVDAGVDGDVAAEQRAHDNH